MARRIHWFVFILLRSEVFVALIRPNLGTMALGHPRGDLQYGYQSRFAMASRALPLPMNQWNTDAIRCPIGSSMFDVRCWMFFCDLVPTAPGCEHRALPNKVMGPMRAKNGVGAFHVPSFRPRPRPRSDNLASRTSTSTRTNWFMVPMHAWKREEAFHQSSHPLAPPRRGTARARPRFAGRLARLDQMHCAKSNGLMRAMVLTQPRQVLREMDLPTPNPRAGEVLVRVRACAVCRTDLHVVEGELAHPKLPLVPGHEIVGEVLERGEGAERFVGGARVGIPWLGWTCGECRFCRAGHENLCEQARFTGYTLDGGYAEFALADERFCFSLPDFYSDAEV